MRQKAQLNEEVAREREAEEAATGGTGVTGWLGKIKEKPADRAGFFVLKLV